MSTIPAIHSFTTNKKGQAMEDAGLEIGKCNTPSPGPYVNGRIRQCTWAFHMVKRSHNDLFAYGRHLIQNTLMNNLKSLFLLDPDVHFLNHGSFGAVPKPVLDTCYEWLKYVEKQPVRFFQAELGELLTKARAELGQYVNAPPENVVFVPNATYAINMVARSLALQAGDEVLTTNHEYGACDNVWTFLSQKQCFHYVKQEIDLPLTTPEAIVDQLWQGVTERTRVIFISHISSSTAVIFPIAAICQRAREAGILTIIDGAHAVGQISLDMTAVNADFYTSNCHKWLCSPKGSAFLYARPEVQPLLDPLVVSWGWAEDRNFSYGSSFLDNLQWPGTWDVSAYLSVPAAIQFQAENGWTAVRHHCHALLTTTIDRVCHLTGQHSIYSSDQFYAQMGVAPLPAVAVPELKAGLLSDFQVEIPIVEWHGRCFVRISVQGYNNQTDLDALFHGLEDLLPRFKK